MLEFASVARRYCAFVERAAELPVEDRVRQVRELLAELYLAACRLPPSQPAGGDAPEPSGPPPWVELGGGPRVGLR